MRAALIVASLACATVAHASPSQELDDANAAFRNGQLAIALEKYNALLYPPPPKLASTDEIVGAYVNLGVCRLDASDVDGAKREFEKALQLDPNKQLDPLLVTNKDAIRLFDDTKADIRNRAREAAAKEENARLLARQQEILNNTRFYEQHYAIYNFFPPAGQVQNGQKLKAIAFGGGELVTLGASAGIWIYLAEKYGVNNQHLHVSTDEATQIRALQEIEIGTGIAFIGLYVYGVVDAYRHYKPQVQTSIPAEFRDLMRQPTPPKPKKTTVLDRLHFTPLVTPSGAGLGVAWEE